MFDEPEDTAARKRAQDGPPEDSTARAIADERERLHAIAKAALAPTNAMHSVEHMQLRKMRQYNPVVFAKHINARIVERLQSSGTATVTDLQKWRSTAERKPDPPPPRTPRPRSPNRQEKPLAKIVTDATSQHCGLGDLLREKLVAIAT